MSINLTLEITCRKTPDPFRVATLIKPTDPAARKGLSFDDMLARSVQQNVKASVRALAKIPDLALVIEKRIAMIVGCVYDIASGAVRFIDA